MRSPADMGIIQIEITNKCARRCSNCTRLSGHYRPDQLFDMSFDQFQAAVDSMAGFPEIVGVMGGEPTMHPEFARFIAYYRERIPNPRQRGLWSSLHESHFKHLALINDTFPRDRQFLNDHATPSIHTPVLVASAEVMPDVEQRRQFIERCWVQNLWSASITPKGAFFCEIAAALDTLFDGPGGWPVEPGWWHIQPGDPRFREQVERYCHMCGAAMPLKRRRTSDVVDDVSPGMLERLKAQGSPKARRGGTVIYDGGFVESYHPTADWYLESPEARISPPNQERLHEAKVEAAGAEAAPASGPAAGAPRAAGPVRGGDVGLSGLVEGIVVCVDYADYLQWTLPQAMRLLDRCIVVTSSKDQATQRLCYSIPHVSCLVTDAFYEGGAKFAKSRALAIARRYLSLGGWVLFWDADILFPTPSIERLKGALGGLDKSMLYAPGDRLHLQTGIIGRNVHHGGHAAAGFFQLVHSSALANASTPTTSSDASQDDILFSMQFGPPAYLNLPVIHLGPTSADGEPNVNWSGRKSEPCALTKEEIERMVQG